jgi:transcription termination factor Rho
MTITNTAPANTPPANIAPNTAPATAKTREARPVEITGVVDIRHNTAYVRTRGYRPDPADIQLPLSQVNRYGLRTGDYVRATVRPPRGQAGQGGGTSGQKRERRDARREKAGTLVGVAAVNGISPEEARNRAEFENLTPVFPDERLRLETGPDELTGRAIDLVAPIGKGQRGLIVAPPKAGKTLTLKALATAIRRNNPECHLMMVLVDERPEEVTDMRRSVDAEVIHSTFDRQAAEHVACAELAIERAKRLVELGRDVVVILDSITRLARAYNLGAAANSRILAGGVATTAIHPPRRFLGAARNIEGGGSLTILASALVDTGSRMDDLLFEEFKGTGNMELRLHRGLADKRIFPAVHVASSSTRRDDLLTSPAELRAVSGLRRVLHGLDPQEAVELLLAKLRDTGTNAEFLAQIAARRGPRDGL